MRPRVVLLSAFLTPFRSGAEACAEEVTQRLVDRYDVTIITARLRRSLPRADHLGPVPVIRVGLGLGIDKWLYPFLAPLAARRLKPDLIHAVLESYAGLALVLCKWMGIKAKRLLTLQSTNTSLFLGIIHKAPHALTAISTALVLRASRFNRKDVSVIPNGAPVRDLSGALAVNGKVPGRLLFVGRLEPMKGVDTLLSAFAEVERPVHAHLHIVGDGSQRATLERLSQRLNLQGRVTFLGRLSGPDLYREYAEAEVFCGLSRSEGLGNVFLEAQAARCGVIATRVGGIPDVVLHQKTGLLVEPNSFREAAAALTQLLTDGQLRLRLADAAMRHAAGYDWDGIAQRYDSAYRSVLSLH